MLDTLDFWPKNFPTELRKTYAIQNLIFYSFRQIFTATGSIVGKTEQKSNIFRKGK